MFRVVDYSELSRIKKNMLIIFITVWSGNGGGGGMENNCSGNYDYSELFKAFVGPSTQQATFKSTKHLTLLSQNGHNLINITKKLL